MLFIGLWNFSDDQGIHPASLKRLKMEVFPADDVTIDDIAAWIGELTSQRLVLEYEADGERYWIITGWKKHQQINRPTAKYPPPPSELFNESSRSTHGALTEDSRSVHPRNGCRCRRDVDVEGNTQHTSTVGAQEEPADNASPDVGGVSDSLSANPETGNGHDADHVVASWYERRGQHPPRNAAKDIAAGKQLLAKHGPTMVLDRILPKLAKTIAGHWPDCRHFSAAVEKYGPEVLSAIADDDKHRERAAQAEQQAKDAERERQQRAAEEAREREEDEARQRDERARYARAKARWDQMTEAEQESHRAAVATENPVLVESKVAKRLCQQQLREACIRRLIDQEGHSDA